MAIPDDADYIIRSYSPFPRRLLLETWHRGEASRDMEIAVYRARMARGEVASVDVIALKPPYGTTHLP